MPPVQSSAKALAILLAGMNRGLVQRSAGTPLRFEQARLLGAAARRGSSDGLPLVEGWKRSQTIGNLQRIPPSRSFLGVGDGEEGDVLSKSYEERRVMGYSPEQLFNVVAAVDLYEDFLPWCQRSRIIRHNSDASFDAELEIGFKFLVESYVSHVELQKYRYIKTTALNTGLFDHLINNWEFSPGPMPGTSDVYFLVDFKFQSPLYRQVASMFFKEVVSRLVGSFSDRCRRIYGPSIQNLENPYGEAGSSGHARS